MKHILLQTAFHNEFVIETRGAGLAHHVFEGYEPWQGEMRSRPTGSLIADRKGVTTTYSLLNAQERGQLFIPVATAVYEGMIIGEHSRPNDLEVNVLKGKKLTNVRASGTDEAVKLIPPISMSLEQMMSYIREDELLEVTPNNLRLRKKLLHPIERKRKAKT